MQKQKLKKFKTYEEFRQFVAAHGRMMKEEYWNYIYKFAYEIVVDGDHRDKKSVARDLNMEPAKFSYILRMSEAVVRNEPWRIKCEEKCEGEE